MTSLLITCEHGGNQVPARFRMIFRAHRELLESHRGFDRGALQTARLLAHKLHAPIHAATVSRLIVDTNRSLGNRDLFSEITRELPEAHRQEALRHYYHPHRERIEATTARLLRGGGLVVHVASHSFTPIFGRERRNVDVAWLYDPGRPRERRFVDSWRKSLRAIRPDLRLRRNYPYRGVSDGLTTHLRRLFPASRYLGIELEVNQASTTPELRYALLVSLDTVLRAQRSKR